MPGLARIACFCCLGFFIFSQTGCNTVPRRQLAQSQIRARQLYDQNRAMAAAHDTQIQAMGSEQQKLQQQLADMQASRDNLQASRDALQGRVDNLLGERSQLQSRFASLAKQNSSPLSDDSTKRFEDLARRYPEFEFDPQTGVSKFKSDVLFESGSDAIRPAAEPLLREFAKILNTGDATLLNVLVVGHTDDKRIAKANTRAKHPDNWYLSSHRAINVTHLLSKYGLKENRMGVAGYGPHQPVAANADESSRQRNRRVEIFVLAPNATLASK